MLIRRSAPEMGLSTPTYFALTMNVSISGCGSSPAKGPSARKSRITDWLGSLRSTNSSCSALNGGTPAMASWYCARRRALSGASGSVASAPVSVSSIHSAL